MYLSVKILVENMKIKIVVIKNKAVRFHLTVKNIA